MFSISFVLTWLVMWLVVAFLALQLTGYVVASSASGSAKLLAFLGLTTVLSYSSNVEGNNAILESVISYSVQHPLAILLNAPLLWMFFREVQQSFRYARLNALKSKYGFTRNAKTYNKMSLEVAQEVEANMAEYEFPRLYQFAWISDFLRTATDPGVSRALIRSGHMVNPDPLIEHERLQATIHLMGAFMAYPLKSPTHSKVIARINEHHHRYGQWINSDDILFLIIHFAMIPGHWINRFGYRALEPFEEHALWILWREIGVMMGCRYMPEDLQSAKQWRAEFEKECRWPCDENEQAGMAMMNELIYSVPGFLKPLFRMVVVSILDWDIVALCQMEKLGRSSSVRFCMYRLFDTAAFFIRNFGFPRLTPYERTFEEYEAKEGESHKPTVHVRNTPYDTLPFYQKNTWWNKYGFVGLLKRAIGLPAPSPSFYSEGTTIEAMGAAQLTAESQITVEQKVLRKAHELSESEDGYRPAIAYQAGRLLGPIKGSEYGASLNRYPEGTEILPKSDDRFDPKYERRLAGFSKIGAIETSDDIMAFDGKEAYGKSWKKTLPVVSVSA